jgi:hypothetical protein
MSGQRALSYWFYSQGKFNMPTPNALFVKWVKTTQPRIFALAANRARTRSTLGGLGDDLVGDVSVDTSTVSVDPSVTAAVDQAAADQTSSDTWSGLIDSIANAVTTVAPAVVQSQAQLSTIQLNQQRAAAGLPPIGATSLLTGAGLTGSTGLMLLALLGGGALLMLSKK